MSSSETSSRTTAEPTYKGRKSAIHTWPVGYEPILKKLPSFPDYEQLFAPTKEQMREMMIYDEEDEHIEDEDSLFIVVEGVRYEEEVCSYKPTWDYEENVEESEEEDKFEEKSDSDDLDWDPKENYAANKKKHLAKKKK
jgi:hypothetical protein